MDIQEAYEVTQAEWVELNNVKVGDKVRCTRKFTESELGYLGRGWSWTNEKERFCKEKKIGTISGFGKRTIYVCSDRVGDCSRNFPWFVLEIVEQAPPEKMIEVAGREWSESTIVEALKRHMEGDK